MYLPMNTVPIHHGKSGKSWNLRKEFSRPGQSWKMTVVMEFHQKVMEFFNERIIILAV